MASLTKKIIAQQSQATVTTIINHTSPLPRLVIPLLSSYVQDKAVQSRTYAMGHIKTFLAAHGQRAKHAIEASGGVETLEKCVKKGLADPNPAVKDTTRQVFWVFDEVWSDRGRVMLESLDPMSRKQLEKACPKPDLLTGLATAVATPQVKKQSVAAAIAASRAKAKAIATAPPSLRHQATSAARTTSPPAKRPASPSLSSGGPSVPARANSPVNRVPSSSSSSPPRARVVSGGALSRSTNSGFVPNRDQSRPAVPTVPASPPSPTPEFRRRVSSPLAGSPNGSPGTLRRAMQTALPASPPRSSVLLQGGTSHRPQPLQMHGAPHMYRESINIAGLHASAEDSLLLASNIPIPEDSDSDMDVDTSVNLISFSTPYEMYPPEGAAAQQAKSAASFSPRSSSSRPPLSNALSTGTSSPPAGVPQPMVEDAMRARAEQAESAAERLLELVDPEDEDEEMVVRQSSTVPASLLLRSTTPEASIYKAASARGDAGRGGSSPRGLGALGATPIQPPRTPVSKSAAIMRKAALFQDSPAYKARASTSPFDVINGQTQDNVWWRKRMSRKSIQRGPRASSNREGEGPPHAFITNCIG